MGLLLATGQEGTLSYNGSCVQGNDDPRSMGTNDGCMDEADELPLIRHQGMVSRHDGLAGVPILDEHRSKGAVGQSIAFDDEGLGEVQ